MKARLGAGLVALAIAGLLAATAVAAATPSVTTQGVTDVKDTSAVLNGKVNPNSSSTKYWFVWGLTSAYGNTTTKHAIGDGHAALEEHLTIDKLLPGTKYYYRLYAMNHDGLSTGAGHSFKTTGHPLPGVTTGSAIDVTGSAATLTGTVTPNGEATQWEFEYGISATALSVAPGGGTVPAGTEPVAVSDQITGLESGTPFYYRLVAIHPGFPSSDGLNQVFTTMPLVRPYATVHASTTPHRGFAPQAFTTLGSITPSTTFPGAIQCTGQVTVKYFAGHRRVRTAVVPVEPNCTFSATTTFTHTFRLHGQRHRPQLQRLRLVIRFGGNGYLAPASAKPGHIVVGN